MFTVILQSEKKKWFPRCGYRIKIAREATVSHIQVMLCGKKVRWNRLKHQLGGTASCVVLQQGVALPKECGIVPIDTQPLAHRLLKNAAADLLRSCPQRQCRRNIALIDLRGVYHDVARVLAKDCGCLKIVTLHAASYQSLAEQLLAESGAVLQVTDTLENPNENLAIVSPAGLNVDFGGKLTVPVFTLEPEVFHGVVTVSGFSVETPLPETTGFPAGLDQEQLFSALYQFCGGLNLAGQVPTHCRVNNEKNLFREAKTRWITLDSRQEVAI